MSRVVAVQPQPHGIGSWGVLVPDTEIVVLVLASGQAHPTPALTLIEKPLCGKTMFNKKECSKKYNIVKCLIFIIRLHRSNLSRGYIRSPTVDVFIQLP